LDLLKTGQIPPVVLTFWYCSTEEAMKGEKRVHKIRYKQAAEVDAPCYQLEGEVLEPRKQNTMKVCFDING
jgi:hypothetical protein